MILSKNTPMNKTIAVLSVVILAAYSCSSEDSDISGGKPAEEEAKSDTVATVEDTVVTFSAMQGTFAGTALPYRLATIAASTGTRPALVVYLHGGTVRGNDNVAQMNEAGIDSISSYLSSRRINAVMVVPQCPAGMSWGGTMLPVLKAMTDDVAEKYSADTCRIYLFGGSMGGTGTWGMLSAYPNMFAAAMPVAGNPAKCAAANVACTPVYVVMGTADKIMSTDTVKTFVTWIDAASGETKLDIEDGWTHEITCIRSYTADRLDWIFAHRRHP